MNSDSTRALRILKLATEGATSPRGSAELEASIALAKIAELLAAGDTEALADIRRAAIDAAAAAEDRRVEARRRAAWGPNVVDMLDWLRNATRAAGGRR